MQDLFLRARRDCLRAAEALALILCCACVGFGSPGGSSARAFHIGKISIEQQNVFDESDSTFLRVVGSVVNTVHILTDEEVIRRELLFKEGDPYDQRLLDESGQNLRRLGIVGDVVIASDTLPDNTVNVTVRARDRWTLRPGITLRQDGEREGYSVSVRDENFLGNAQKLRIGYNHLSGPGSPHGGEIAFTDPRLWGSRWSTTVQYGVSQELRVGAFNAECPFYSASAPWAARISADVSRMLFREFHGGMATRTGYLNQENQLAWVAFSSRADASLRVAAAYVRTRTRAFGVQVRPFENVDLVIGSVSLLRRDYVRTNSADSPGRIEDVPLGYQAGVALGRNLHFSEAGAVDYFIKAFGQRSLAFGGNFFASYQALVTSYFESGVPNETTISGVVLHQWRASQNQSLIGRVAAILGSHWSPSSQLILGASTGLRGYRIYELIGQRMLLVNLEHRMLSLIRVWFLRLGGALFFDSGAMWDQDERPGSQRFHSSAGFGLRVNVGSAILRVDAAYNFDRQRVSLGLSANQLFRILAPLEFDPPVPGQPLR